MRSTLITFGAALLLLGCAEKGSGPVVSNGGRYSAPVSAPGQEVADYRLDVGDSIKIVVYNEPSASGEFTVGARGTVDLPLIGEIPAQGQTVRQVAAEARTRLADGYLRQPQVSAEVSVYRPFYILGEVAQPGQYPYAVGLTVLNAIATAKGFTARANQEVVQIRQQGESGETNYRVTPDLHVRPGDTIRVGERYF